MNIITQHVSRMTETHMTTLKNWVITHQNLAAWIALAIGMDAILIYEARDVGLEPSQWVWLIVITTLVAGACVWIISWGDDEEEEVNG